jgi:hypothetical protein
LVGQTQISGWAINNSGISQIRVLLNAKVVAETSRTLARDDVVTLKNTINDPGAPLLGFAAEIDTTIFENGRYQLSLELITGAGERQFASTRNVRINNP